MIRPSLNQEMPSSQGDYQIEGAASLMPTPSALTPVQASCHRSSPVPELSSPPQSIPSSPLFTKNRATVLEERQESPSQGDVKVSSVVQAEKQVVVGADKPISESQRDELASTKISPKLASRDITPSQQENATKESILEGTKRKREMINNGYEEHAFDPPYRAATDAEKETWQGFCEIESEPAIFNSMLRKWGVKGVKIQEMFGIDEDALMMLPQQVYGIIFLFQYEDEDAGAQETECPSHVWFANQVTSNSCATVALMNMVNNIPSVTLGPDLDSFRKFTMPFSPAIRGEQVANYKVIKQTHNSYARKIDMLNVDSTMEQDFKDHQKKARKTGGSKKRRTKKMDVDDNAFHFVAYMPILGEIWKLDGLDSQPQSIMSLSPEDSGLGALSWLQSLAPVLQARMIDCQDGGIQFNLLAMVQDPLVDAQQSLVKHIRLVKALNMSELVTNLEEYGICDTDITEVEDGELGFFDKERVAECAGDDAKLSSLKDQVRQEGVQIRSGVRAEKALVDAEEEKARDRMNDYGPFIQKWLLLLAENGVLKDIAMSDD
jgi:ubiquitin carboxyl-terminal hydrolase L5